MPAALVRRLVRPGSGGARFADLDGIRGLCALWVVVFHMTFGLRLWVPDDPALVRQIAPFTFNIEGLLGVDMFFLVSGFVIAITVERSRSLLDFVASRAARLFPAYWAAVLLAAAVGGVWPPPWAPPTLPSVLANMTMLQDYLAAPPMNPSFWSLSVELGFYVLMALVILSRRRHRMESLAVLWVVVAVMLMHVAPANGLALPWRLATLTALSYAPLFCAGLLFHRMRADRPTWPRLAGVGLCLAARMLLAPASLAVFAPVIFLIFGMVVAGWLPVLRWRPLLFLGSVSYSLYVLHQPISFHLQLAFHRLGLGPWGNLAASLAVLVALAAASARWIERPGGRLIRTAWGRLARPPVAASP